MTASRTLILASMICSLSAGSVLAQADRTGTGGGPLSTEKAPNTTAVGQTKPPSRDASPASVRSASRSTPHQVADRIVSRRICTGCVPDPSETGSLSTSPPNDTATRSDVRLDELQSAPEPKPQADLNTVALASAHRERARSTEERTTGLWQSWLVSVCDGCGDQKPAKALKLEDWPDRDAPMVTGTVEQKPSPNAARSAEVERSGRRQGTLEANLSPENLHAIRRMP